MKRKNMFCVLIAVLVLAGCSGDKSNRSLHAASKQGRDVMEEALEQQTARAEEGGTDEAGQSGTEEAVAETATQAQPDAAMQNGAIDLEPLPESDVDVDLTKMNATMVYARVLNLLMHPETYVGMTVRMSGKLARYVDPETEAQYFACIIPDATACCAQGIEFVRKGDFRFPEDYPELDEEVVVVGVLEIYEENGMKFIHLNNADMQLADAAETSNG